MSTYHNPSALDLARKRKNATTFAFALRCTVVGFYLATLFATGSGSVALWFEAGDNAVDLLSGGWLVLAFADPRHEARRRTADRVVRAVMVAGSVAALALLVLGIGRAEGGGRLVVVAAIVSLVGNGVAALLQRAASHGPGGKALWRESLHIGAHLPATLLLIASQAFEAWFGWEWADPAAPVVSSALLIVGALLPHHRDDRDGDEMTEPVDARGLPRRVATAVVTRVLRDHQQADLERAMRSGGELRTALACEGARAATRRMRFCVAVVHLVGAAAESELDRRRRAFDELDASPKIIALSTTSTLRGEADRLIALLRQIQSVPDPVPAALQVAAVTSSARRQLDLVTAELVVTGRSTTLAIGG